MPTIVHGDVSSTKQVIIQRDYEYDYPNGLDLRPNSKLHSKLVSLILEKANTSNKAMSSRFDSWNKIDKTLTAYMITDDAEEKVQRKDDRKPVSIVFPYSYAMLETLLTYLFIAFVQEPIFRYEGASQEDYIGAALMEMAINLQCVQNKVGLSLHTQFRDTLSYGLGVVTPDWVIRRGYKTVRGFDESLGIPTKYREPTILFEGNALNNIDPYRYLPDPNFSIHEQQKAEFQGWIVTENMHSLIRDEEFDSSLFNAKYLKGVRDKRSVYGTDQSSRSDKTGISKDTQMADSDVATDVIYMQIDIVPKDYELSEKDTPERWQFALASDSVIIQAEPTKYDHDMYPIAVCAPDFDGYTTTPISRLEIMYGLQHTLDFLFNSHIANVRKAINDMWIVDPQLVNVPDIKDPKPGKIIRLRRPAWGRGVKDVLAQFPVQDITRANIGDSSYIVNWMERIMGADQSMSGSLRQGGPERLTKSEFQGTRQGSVSRLERMAKVIGFQSMYDIGYMFAKHCQQMMEVPIFAKMTGRWTETMLKEFGVDANTPPERMKVDPYQILVDFDLLIRDGSIPGGNFSEAELTLFNTVIQADPEVRQQFDVVRIFEHIARRMGWKNVEDFKRNVGQMQPQVMPDEQVAREAERGNLVPIGA